MYIKPLMSVYNVSSSVCLKLIICNGCLISCVPPVIPAMCHTGKTEESHSAYISCGTLIDKHSFKTNRTVIVNHIKQTISKF